MILSPASCTMSQTSIHSSSGTLSDLIPWLYFSLPLYNHKGFDLGHTWMVYGFPYFLQFMSEFGNKEFMIWATVSFWSCFCWLYRASPSLAAKNIGVGHLVMAMCKGFSCVAGRGCLLWPVCSLGKILIAFALLHSVLQGHIYLLLQVFLDFLLLLQSPIMKRTSFLGVTFKRSCRSS